MNFKKKVNGSWIGTPHYIHKADTDTITTLPAVLYPTATTATVGLKGQAVQSGTPTPDNPIMPEGTGERTRNLCNSTPYKLGYSISATGVENANSEFNILSAKVLSNTQYRLSFSYPENVRLRMVRIHEYSNGAWQSQLVALTCESFPYTFTTNSNIDEVRISIVNTTSEHMINTGSTPLSYEPYGFEISISSARQTTPIYLGEVQTTRKVQKIILTGTEIDIRKNDPASVSYIYYFSRSLGADTCFCSHLSFVNVTSSSIIGISANRDRNVIYLNFGADIMNSQASGNTVEGLKEYLASQYSNGTPVTIWYVLANETTGTVNEPLMKIGDYADEVSNVSIPVTAGGDTLSVDTTVQPSEVTVNYKGWHPVQNVHERNNGAWT